ncbi:TPA_asm: maturation protein [ssRNA phage Esthiorhiza.2_23]|uniref:Maturation protein n=2 Tax=Leviviricetes TaxID=2842243 RepID=A0A8S5L2W7_9VIRU|nr:maturation protein [ssRNA phage Esthiorhiza.2_23]QDH89772.1 MAG: hypothetical protein H2RhizoLitter491484_000003 [Leviviridae sp.]DAD51984.1 TPA_asm: maturation protein [ssRNA phage Esthiorhiza.2_23]
MPYVQQSRALLGSDAYRYAQWWQGTGVPHSGPTATKRPMDPWHYDYQGSQQTYSWRTERFGQDDYTDYEGLTGPKLRARINREYSTRFDNGHEFNTLKKTFEYGGNTSCILGSHVTNTVPEIWTEYRGPMRPEPTTGTAGLYPSFSPPSNHTLDLMGSKAIGLVAPTANEAAFAVFLGEILQDGLPKIPALNAFRERSLGARKGSEEYLNYTFGVKPFKKDLENMAQAVLSSAKKMKQLSRDSDRVVRRRHTFAEEVVDTVQPDEASSGYLGIPNLNGQPIVYSQWFSVLPLQRVVDTVTTRYSFSGAYTYHLAEADNFLGSLDSYIERANHLLGFEINLETIWNLTRWTWLLDWFSNIGNFVHNVSLLHSDNLVLRYGYVMCHTKAQRFRTVTGIVPSANPPTFKYCSHDTLASTATLESKVRRRATPYGFGLDVSSFSDTKWAILGALGLTRAPKALRMNE